MNDRSKKAKKAKPDTPREISPATYDYSAPDEPSVRDAFWCHVPRLSFEMLNQFAEQFKVPVEYAWGGDVFGLDARIRAVEAKNGWEFKDWRLLLMFRVEFTRNGIKVFGPVWL